MAAPTSLHGLNVRESIADALYRCVLAFDMADDTLFESSFVPEANFDLNGRVMSGVKAIRTDCYDKVSKLDTTHFMSNVRVNYKDGESTATLSASALAQHYRAGQGMQPDTTHFLSGSLYFLDLVKDDKEDLWKIKNWKAKIIWTEGDYGVLTGN
ncbi:SnoaL-like domain-containing protein [Hypoxylon crocopeplum]|nr:SnoaL-like domain-containing protein [Hypoxylon crocopeplum]